MTSELPSGSKIELPPPSTRGEMTLEEALYLRRSVRRFSTEGLRLEELSQLLWAGQGITDKAGDRTAPSAGALFPLEIYAVLQEGCYRYEPRRHRLVLQAEGDLRRPVHDVSLSQEFLLTAPVTFVLAAVFARMESGYGKKRSPRYIHMELGHAAQNILLQAVALGLGGVPVGAFLDRRLQQVLQLSADHQPLYLVSVGRPA